MFLMARHTCGYGRGSGFESRAGCVKLCCEFMLTYSAPACVDHTDPHQCPDALIHVDRELGTAGIIVHDGGSSCVDIQYCPWCGKKIGV